MSLEQLLEEAFRGLNPKQRRVLTERFGLRNGSRSTLQEIGDKLGITRERVRQIEEGAIAKVSPKLREGADQLLKFVKTYLANAGGVRGDEVLVKEVSEYLFKKESPKTLGARLRFVFWTVNEPLYHKEDNDFYSFWYTDDGAKRKFLDFIKEAINFFKSKGRVDSNDKEYLFRASSLASCSFFGICKQLGMNIFGDVGLKSWAEIEPKTVRDKIYLVLKKSSGPLHFEDIASSIKNMGFDKKPVHVQTVHNELIKDERFVLVGRGMYALKENGFEPGTVREVIARFLKDSGPLTPKEVVSLVSKQRVLKENTILLNLQNRRFFKRLEDGRYEIKEA